MILIREDQFTIVTIDVTMNICSVFPCCWWFTIWTIDVIDISRLTFIPFYFCFDVFFRRYTKDTSFISNECSTKHFNHLSTCLINSEHLMLQVMNKIFANTIYTIGLMYHTESPSESSLILAIFHPTLGLYVGMT